MKVRHVHDHKGRHPKTHNSPRRFTVDLSEGEVDFLLAVTEGIGGDLTNSPRKYASRIHDALSAVTGYQPHETDAFALLRGALWFTEYTDTKPSLARACYNHIRDSVTMYSLLGRGVTKLPAHEMQALTSVGDTIASELVAQGETLDDLPVPHFDPQDTISASPRSRRDRDIDRLNRLYEFITG